MVRNERNTNGHVAFSLFIFRLEVISRFEGPLSGLQTGSRRGILPTMLPQKPSKPLTTPMTSISLCFQPRLSFSLSLSLHPSLLTPFPLLVKPMDAPILPRPVIDVALKTRHEKKIRTIDYSAVVDAHHGPDRQFATPILPRRRICLPWEIGGCRIVTRNPSHHGRSVFAVRLGPSDAEVVARCSWDICRRATRLQTYLHLVTI